MVENKSILSRRIKILATEEEKKRFRKCSGVARWAYNKHLENNWLKLNDIKNYYIKESTTRKVITLIKGLEEYSWLKEVGTNVPKQAIKDAEIAFQNWFQPKNGMSKPKFKVKGKEESFYINYESLKRTENGFGFYGEKLNTHVIDKKTKKKTKERIPIKLREDLPILKEGKHYSNPRITFDGDDWWLSIGFCIEDLEDGLKGIKINNFSFQDLTDEVIGIDLGLEHLAVCSNGKYYMDINKTREVIRLERKLKREQRKLSRKKKMRDKSKPMKECKNIQKQKKKIRKLYKRLRNIRLNHIHQVTSSIIKTRPRRIVLENLRIKNMMKNRRLSKRIQSMLWHEFRRQIEYKSKLHGIEVIIADTFYPSSKKCSCCGHIKKKLKLNERDYYCPVCGLLINRDYNASVNLKYYQPEEKKAV